MATTQVFTTTLNQLKALSLTHDAVLVAFSGGKDSLVCLDLCTRIFKRVVPFYFWFIPGLEVAKDRLALADSRWGLSILHYPHPLIFEAMREGLYTWESYKLNDLHSVKISLRESYEWVCKDTGIDLIVAGHKKADGQWRRRELTIATNIYEHVHHPLKEWNKWDVLAYCKAHQIPVPHTYAGTSTSISLSPDSLEWLYTAHPEDFRRLSRIFPFAEAKVLQRRWYPTAKETLKKSIRV
jgi:phosphoadenosine phosphosulfate reductase